MSRNSIAGGSSRALQSLFADIEEECHMDCLRDMHQGPREHFWQKLTMLFNGRVRESESVFIERTILVLGDNKGGKESGRKINKH